jgi:UPF0755 protein
MEYLEHIQRFFAARRDELRRSTDVYDRFLPVAFLVGIALFLGYYVTFSPPVTFPSASLVKIPKGSTLASEAKVLQDRHLIRSATLFIWSAKLFGAANSVIPGEYFFSGPQSVVQVARRLAHGDFELVPVRVTIPEGLNAQQVAKLLSQDIADFDVQGFLDEAQSKEGYLFPDTYYFLPGEDPTDIVAALETNFQKKVSDSLVTTALQSFGKPLPDIVTMASLLEKEASNSHDRQIIAGILWKRVTLGMPLQVDAVFPYIIGKNSFQLTHADLQTQSPYNTYVNKGLPPGPIANPGVGAILAAVTPIKTTYLYYLSDMQGNFHFCATYSCQLANQRKYLQ